MKRFNITGVCIPEKHYMVNLTEKVDKIINDYILQGAYFTINRAGQYGKTTIMNALDMRLSKEYIVLNLSFEAADDYFTNLQVFVNGIAMDITEELRRNGAENSIIEEWGQKIDR